MSKEEERIAKGRIRTAKEGKGERERAGRKTEGGTA